MNRNEIVGRTEVNPRVGIRTRSGALHWIYALWEKAGPRGDRAPYVGCGFVENKTSRKRFRSAAPAATITLAIALSLTRAEANGLASASLLQPPDLVAFQGFGFAVAADGNVLAAGSQFAPFVVYVYTNNNGNWSEQAELISPSGNSSNHFGSSLALQGNTLVVGGALGNGSAAYVYTNVNGTWLEQAVLVPSGGAGTGFAGSPLNGMALSGNTLAIGAPSESTPAGNTGSVYVFVNSNGQWTQQQRIMPADSLVAGFGLSVSLQNDNLLVGAPFTTWPNVFQPGAAFLFSRQSGAWNQAVRFDPVDVVAAGLFGEFVSLDAKTVAIGAPRPCEAEIFVNNNNTWGLQSIIAGPDDSDFGTSLKVIGDLLMVSAYDDVSPAGIQSGDAFIYTRGGSTWTEQPSLYMAPGFDGIPGPAEDRQRFGNFATMTKAGSKTIFVIGSQLYSNPDASRVGAVYTATLN